MSNRNAEVDAWLQRYDNPLKDLVQEVREAVLASDERVTEVIKWLPAGEVVVVRGAIDGALPVPADGASRHLGQAPSDRAASFRVLARETFGDSGAASWEETAT